MMDKITDIGKLKEDMKELWKETFHDTDRYVDLVFDTYFSPENCFVRYDENRLIASLLSIPYEFQILTREGDKRQARGIYLCGLATRPEWRRRGIMSQLMTEAETSARKRGYDISFLIPADSHLREYYKGKDYHTAAWRTRIKYEMAESNQAISSSEVNVYAIKDFMQGDNFDFVWKLAGWCREIELSRDHNTIVHSQKDFLTIMAENENSFFITDTTFDPEYPILAKVACVAFPELSDDSNERLRIVGLYIHNFEKEETGKAILLFSEEYERCQSKLLNAILKEYSRKELELILPTVGSLNKNLQKNRRVLPYAMAKILGNTIRCDENENPEFEISLMLD